jgi:hypothetical protein
MPVKLVKVKNCRVCPYSLPYPLPLREDGGQCRIMLYCGWMGRVRLVGFWGSTLELERNTTTEDIPKWCPLEDDIREEEATK